MSTSYLHEISAVVVYLALLLAIGFFSYKKHLTEKDFIIGSRSLNYWLTAMAAQASDMSSWLFMGYPAAVFSLGIFGAWNAIGLIVFMYLNWTFIAPKIRVATEKFNSLTLSSYFESRLKDNSGIIRILTALISLFFFTVYISAGLTGLGVLLNNLFGISYDLGVLIGIFIVIPYVFIGGYLTLAWIDFFQGIFLMCVVLFVPLYLLPKVGGFGAIESVAAAKNLSLSLFPNFSLTSFSGILMALGWGLGYFGQPHILTKFMGIKDVREIPKSKYFGMTWMAISLFAATLVGLVGLAYFNGNLADTQQVFIQMVKESFPAFMTGIIFCAVLATTINATSSQVLVLASNISEDFYKKIVRKNAGSKELLLVSRAGVILVAIVAYFIAREKLDSIYSLVFYAWSGLGASFGPLLLYCLYSKKINKYGGFAGILGGGIVAGIWPYLDHFSPISLPSVLPGFICSCLCIMIFSKLTKVEK